MATDKTLEIRAAKRSMLATMIQEGAHKQPSTFGRKAVGYRMFHCDVDGALFPNEVSEGRCCYCGNVLSWGESMDKQFSDEADTCEECQAEGFTLEHGVIRDPGKFEGEPLAAFHAYHTMLDGFADDNDGPAWRIGNVICEESEQGFVYCEIHDTEEQAIAAWEASEPGEDEETED